MHVLSFYATEGEKKRGAVEKIARFSSRYDLARDSIHLPPDVRTN